MDEVGTRKYTDITDDGRQMMMLEMMRLFKRNKTIHQNYPTLVPNYSVRPNWENECLHFIIYKQRRYLHFYAAELRFGAVICS